MSHKFTGLNGGARTKTLKEAHEMTEREKIVEYLRTVAMSRPPQEIRDKHPEWTDDVLFLGEAMLMTAASQIESGAFEGMFA